MKLSGNILHQTIWQSGDYIQWIVRFGLMTSRGKITVQMASLDDPTMVMGNALAVD
jgi:hypothetical protein